MIETGVEERTDVDVLPFDARVKGSITESYIEFRIWPTVLTGLVDLLKLVLEVKEPPLGGADNVVLCNAALHTMILF